MNEKSNYIVDYLTAGTMSYLSLYFYYLPKYLSTQKDLNNYKPMNEWMIQKNHHRDNTKVAIFGKDSSLFDMSMVDEQQ